MDYMMKFKFQADTDDEAKELLNEMLEEMDSRMGYSILSTKGELFYTDGETRVP